MVCCMIEEKDHKASKAAQEADFGFKRVDVREKQHKVNDVFHSVADQYDIMNDVMSGGLHRIWKDIFIDHLNPPRSNRAFHLLDVAGGTGDIALKYLERSGEKAVVTLTDINPSMLEIGQARIAQKGFSDRCECATANAEKLPFDTGSFDAYTIAFGIRNVTHIDKALAEAYRVLKTGGRFLCLEFSKVDVPFLDSLYDAYSFTAIPALGQMITGDGDSYRYLVESIRKFPSQEKFASLISHAGFSRVKYDNLSAGIVSIHSGWKL